MRRALKENYLLRIYSINGQESIETNSRLFNLSHKKARDEAHRFAIKANRNAKRENMQVSILDSIRVLGSKPKKDFNEFKSIDAILNFPTLIICKILGGVDKRMAIQIKKLRS